MPFSHPFETTFTHLFTFFTHNVVLLCARVKHTWRLFRSPSIKETRKFMRLQKKKKKEASELVDLFCFGPFINLFMYFIRMSFK